MKTVMVVEDDPDTNRLLCKLVSRMGHRAVSAASGERAVAVLNAHSVDLVILDHMMPGMSGLDLLRLMRAGHAIAAAASTPVVMFTAVADPAFRAMAADSGANEYLPKSDFDLAVFQSVVAKYV